MSRYSEQDVTNVCKKLKAWARTLEDEKEKELIWLLAANAQWIGTGGSDTMEGNPDIEKAADAALKSFVGKKRVRKRRDNKNDWKR